MKLEASRRILISTAISTSFVAAVVTAPNAYAESWGDIDLDILGHQYAYAIAQDNFDWSSTLRLGEVNDDYDVKIANVMTESPRMVGSALQAKACNYTQNAQSGLLTDADHRETVVNEVRAESSDTFETSVGSSFDIAIKTKASFLGLIESEIENKFGLSLNRRHSTTSSTGWANRVEASDGFTQASRNVVIPPGKCYLLEGSITEVRTKATLEYWQQVNGGVAFRKPHPHLNGYTCHVTIDADAILNNVSKQVYPNDMLFGENECWRPPHDGNGLKHLWGGFDDSRIRFNARNVNDPGRRVYVRQQMDVTVPKYRTSTTLWELDKRGRKVSSSPTAATNPSAADAEDGILDFKIPKV